MCIFPLFSIRRFWATNRNIIKKKKKRKGKIVSNNNNSSNNDIRSGDDRVFCFFPYKRERNLSVENKNT